MSKAFPFRRPPSDVVRAAPWSRSVADGKVELPNSIPDWDYDTVLELSRAVEVDGRRARSACGLDGGDSLELMVRWASSTSLLRGRAWRISVPDEDKVELDIAFSLPGGELGGSLELETVLTLGATPAKAVAAAPRRPGSILWSEGTTTLLQGDTALFPLAVADFTHQPIPTGAPWYLELGEDLDAAALGSILLLANERCTAVVSALTTAGAPDEAARGVLSMLRTDVVRSMIEHALADDDFDENVEYETGSLGAVLQALFRNTFDLPTVESLRRERMTSPILFSARLQDATNLLADL